LNQVELTSADAPARPKVCRGAQLGQTILALLSRVMAGLDPAIQALVFKSRLRGFLDASPVNHAVATWMAGSSPAMTLI
jgi:hypothetical protein